MAPSTTRRPSWLTVTPALAVAVLGLAACTNSQESSDVQGTTPPVWTGAPEPAHGDGDGHGHGDEGGHSSSSDAKRVDVKDAGGNTVATADIAAEGGHLVITVEATGLRPGFHGLHFHQVGRCETNSVAPTGGAPGDFLSAGGHLQVGGASGHPASGDLTSLQIREDGRGKLVTTTDKVTLDDLTDRALIIHAGADNFANIPDRYTHGEGATGPDETTLATGDAGGRVACGVIQ